MEGLPATRKIGRSCGESLPESWEASGCPPKGSGGVRWPSWRAGRCLEAHQEGREELGDLLVGQEGSGGYPRGPGEIWRLSSGLKHLVGMGGVRRPFRRAVRGWENPVVGPRGVGRLSQSAGIDK